MTAQPSLAEQVFHLEPPFEDPDAMMSRAYTALTGEQTDVGQLLVQNESLDMKIQSRIAAVGLAAALYEFEPDVMERWITVNTLRHVFKEDGAAYGTVLGALPLYHTLYLEHVGLSEPGNTTGKAVLIGSNAPASSAAFVTLSDCVFRAEPWIVDPVGGCYKQRHGNFFQKNALSLPESWSGSAHVVVTNRLLHMLRGVDNKLITTRPESERQGIQTFAKKMFRLLQAGGHLILCEQPPQLDMKDFWCEGEYNRGVVATFEENMRAILAETGFSKISITTGGETGNAGFLYQPLDPESPVTPKIQRLGSVAIYAQKPL